MMTSDKILSSINALLWIGLAVWGLGSFEPESVGEAILVYLAGGFWLAVWCWELAACWSGYGTPAWRMRQRARGHR